MLHDAELERAKPKGDPNCPVCGGKLFVHAMKADRVMRIFACEFCAPTMTDDEADILHFEANCCEDVGEELR
jgi:hypothetical protein